jgi:ribosomal protein S18 acetylase RimI-like enzyme
MYLRQSEDTYARFYPSPRRLPSPLFALCTYVVVAYFAFGNLVGPAIGRLWNPLRFRTFVAEDKSKSTILGLCWLRWESSNEASFGILVDEDHRGLGIGTALLERVISAAVESEKSTLILEVYERNESAVELYKSLSFEVYDREKTTNTFTGELAWELHMRRPVNDDRT